MFSGSSSHPSTLSSSMSSPPNREQMSLLSDLKLTAQILGLVILITTLVLALRKFTTNNMGSASPTLAEGNVTSSSQDNIQMIALNVNPV